MNKKRVSIWDNDEELPIDMAEADDMKTPWEDIIMILMIIFGLVGIGFILGRAIG